MTDRDGVGNAGRPKGEDAPNAAAESTKVHGDTLEELIPRGAHEPREPRGGTAANARPPDEENGEAEEPRGHS
jgi:hypothetical protein